MPPVVKNTAWPANDIDRFILEGLKRVRPYLRREMAAHLTMKFIPDLSFASDNSFDEAAHILTLLHKPEVGTYGGGSEAANALAAPAIAAALFDATGKIARKLPLKPEYVQTLLKA